MSNQGKGSRNSGLGHSEPPSPPLSDGQDHYGLHHLQHHNTATQYQQIPYTYGNSVGTYDSSTNFSSPEQVQVSIGQYEASRYQRAFDGSQLTYEYDEFGNPIYYENPPNSVHQGYHQSQYPAPVSYFSSSPPTPVLSDQDGGVTRVLRSNAPIIPRLPSQIPRSATPERSRGPRTIRAAKATKQAKDNEKPKVPKLTAPLSELTKALEHIPIKDMNAWVNRSDEARMKDVKKKNGYITRPMNSFMMYRSAYAERTKIWCLQNNHQIVSAVSGESWPMEPPEIRDLYMEYARRERENHARAHPDYKFQPSKNDTSTRKRKGTPREVDDDEPSDLEDPEYEWRAPPDKKGKGKAKRVKPLPDGYIPSSRERSTYEYNNPGKPLPLPIGDQDMPGQYWQKTVNTVADPLYHLSSRVEDVTIRKTDAPSQYGQVPLIGLPGQQHYELLDLQSWDDSLLMNSSYGFFQGDAHVNPPIDPQLNSLVPGYDSGYSEVAVQDFDEKSFSFDVSSAPSIAGQTTALALPNGLLSSPYAKASSGGMMASRYSTAPAVPSQPAIQSLDGSQEVFDFDQDGTSSAPAPKTNPWVIDGNGNNDEHGQNFGLPEEPSLS